MSEIGLRSLRVVDATKLGDELVAALRPGQVVEDRHGVSRRLPRYFYEIPSWEDALEIEVTPSFSLWEFMDVDLREEEGVRTFPRYVPLAVTVLAAHLEVFRRETDTYVHIAANGGYRSPAHRLSANASPHMWGTAVNIHRVGDDDLDGQEAIERYARLARQVLPALWIRPFGEEPGEADDHMHLDVGYLVVEPRGVEPDDEIDEEDA